MGQIYPRPSVLRQAIVFSVLCLLGFIPPAHTLRAQTNREALLGKAKENFSSALNQLVATAQSLSRKGQALQILSDELIGQRPDERLGQCLLGEIDVLTLLLQSNKLIGDQVAAAQATANGQSGSSHFADIGNNLMTIDNGLEKLQGNLKTKTATRMACKLRLEQLVDGLIAANPVKTQTYTFIKINLDPSSLDSELQQQRNIITSAEIPIKMLQ
jgi:hypothetical protein